MSEKPVTNLTTLASQDSPHFKQPDADVQTPAWEEIEQGRFLPRRIRGSCVGRALG